jgi:hypothetical protein
LRESFTTYLIGVAVPENVGRGSNVTLPVVGFTVYVPSPLIVNVVPLHEAVAVAVVHNLTVVGFRDAAADPESFVRGLMTWFVSYGPVFVSGATVGGGTTVGVYVEVSENPNESVTLYVAGAAVPTNGPVHDAMGMPAALHGWNDSPVVLTHA